VPLKEISAEVAWQYDRPEAGEGLVEAYRRTGSGETKQVFRLRVLDLKATY
jgi:alpha-galactosidase